MKSVCLFLFASVFFSCALLASSIDGTWQGVIIPAGKSIDKGTLLYLELSVNGESVQGKMREELLGTEEFAIKQYSGSFKSDVLSIRQTVVERKSKKAGLKWCLLKMDLTYNATTGYLEGAFESSDCKRFMGKIILYRADFKLSTEATPSTSQLWFTQLVRDMKEGLNAPEIRRLERDNFVFEPIFFDFDKFDVREEHFAFLDRLIKVVKGHSDLRVKVTGHTDSDGTDEYNDLLSKNRAKAIVGYFVAHGLSEDRLIFDFKGEKQPIDTNNTPEGKQRNRRVDFSFI